MHVAGYPEEQEASYSTIDYVHIHSFFSDRKKSKKAHHADRNVT